MRTLLFVLLLPMLLIADSDTVPIGNTRGAVDKKENEPAPETKTTLTPPQTKVAAIEVFGSEKLNEITLKEFLGKDLSAWIALGLKGDEKAGLLEKKLIQKIQAKYQFASADWSVIQYFGAEGPALYITLDVVESEDVAKRMPFNKEPKKTFNDKSYAAAVKLADQWLEYEETAMNMVDAGTLQPDSEECPAFHCPFGHKAEPLKKYEALFVNGAKEHAQKLLEIQKDAEKTELRAAATYLLAYMKDGKKVVAAMINSIKDPDPLVRNNALRVLGEMSDHNQELLIPAAPIIEALTFPRVSDRSKAAYVLDNLSETNQVKEAILKKGVTNLIAMLGSKQPDHKELAHAILRRVSGQTYTADQVASWAAWYRKTTRDTAGK